jgi:hypothetical protein
MMTKIKFILNLKDASYLDLTFALVTYYLLINLGSYQIWMIFNKTIMGCK